MQPGDVYQTWADTTKLHTDYNYRATTSLGKGIEQFALWFKKENLWIIIYSNRPYVTLSKQR